MNHPLPIRPAFIPALPEPEIPASLLASAEAGPSSLPAPSASSTECVICSSPPKYTCPGCQLRTCSLACSKSHKDKYACTGQRDTTAFVPLKNVTEGVWADDYRYLEEGRRKIAEWGDALPKGAMIDSARGGERGRGRGRGRGGARGGRPGGDGRVMGLGRELEKRGVRAEFMPEGMERRKRNQSNWNAKNETLTLTIQLAISTPSEEDRTKFDKKMVNHSRVIVFSPTSSTTLATLESLLPTDMNLQLDGLIFALPYHTINRDTPSPIAPAKGETFFPPLEPKIAIVDALKGTAFVEFPTVHVYSKEEWEALRAESRITIMPLSTDTEMSSASGGKREMRERDDGWKRVRREGAVGETATADTTNVAATVTPIPPAVAIAQAQTAPTPVARPISLGLGLADYGSDDEEDEAEDVLGGNEE